MINHKSSSNLCDLKNDDLKLRNLDILDSHNIKKWLSDPIICKLSFVVPGPSFKHTVPLSENAANQYIYLLLNDPKRISFAIDFNNQHIGIIGLKEYYIENKSAECFIEIGEKQYHNKGLGTKAMYLLNEFAFNQLNIDTLKLDVLEFNFSAIKVYEKLGFCFSHNSGWHLDEDNKYHKVLAMSIKCDTWKTIKTSVTLKSFK